MVERRLTARAALGAGGPVAVGAALALPPAPTPTPASRFASAARALGAAADKAASAAAAAAVAAGRGADKAAAAAAAVAALVGGVAAAPLAALLDTVVSRYAPIGAQLYICEDGLRGPLPPGTAVTGRGPLLPPGATAHGARAALPASARAAFLSGEVDFDADGTVLARRSPFAVHRMAFHRARLAGLLHRAAPGAPTARGVAALDASAAPRTAPRLAEGVAPLAAYAVGGDEGEAVELDVVVTGARLWLIRSASISLPTLPSPVRAALLAVPPPPPAPSSPPAGGWLAGAARGVGSALARGGADAALLRARVPAGAVAAAAAVGGATVTLEGDLDRVRLPLRMSGAPSPAATAAAARGIVRRLAGKVRGG